MKKTLTINLANTVYNIDEDAYQILLKYFENLKVHFKTEKDSEEIMNDIEARFSELFNERLRYGMQVITQKEVQEIISIMGNPSDFGTDNSDESKTEEAEKENQQDSEPEAEPIFPQRQKRLYRDTENGFIGGVAAGFSQYLNIDIVWIRLLFVAFILLSGSTFILIYLLLWIIIPEARTSAQKLEMRGEEPTIENIKKFVKENVEKIAEKTERELKSERTRGFFHEIGEGFARLTQGVAKGIMAIIGGCFGCLGFIILLSLISALAFCTPFIFTGISTPFMPFGTNLYIEGINVGNLAMFPQFIIASLVFIGIPLGAIAYSIFQKIFHWQRTSVAAGWILVGVWLISFAVMIYYGIHYANQIFMFNSFNV
jgi:phage shock protein PspC (stress-responsive transcriptional regulator)